MTNLIACIQSLFEKMSNSADTSVKAGEIDWQEIDETRERLVQMRFKHHRVPYSQSGYMKDVYRPNTALASDATFAATFRQGRPGAHQWVTNYEQSMQESAARESTTEQPAQAINQDETSGAPQAFDQYETSYAPPESQTSFAPSDVSYEPFLIPGVTCDRAAEFPDMP